MITMTLLRLEGALPGIGMEHEKTAGVRGCGRSCHGRGGTGKGLARHVLLSGRPTVVDSQRLIAMNIQLKGRDIDITFEKRFRATQNNDKTSKH